MVLLDWSSLNVLNRLLLRLSGSNLDYGSFLTLLLGHDLLYLSFLDLLQHVLSGHLVDDLLLLLLDHLFCLNEADLLLEEDAVLVESFAGLNLLEVGIGPVSELLLPRLDSFLLLLFDVDQALLLTGDPLGVSDLVVLDLELVPRLEVVLPSLVLQVEGLLQLSLGQGDLIVVL